MKARSPDSSESNKVNTRFNVLTVNLTRAGVVHVGIPLIELSGPVLFGALASLILLFESLVHYPREEAWDEVNKKDDKVDALDLLFVDCPQRFTERKLVTEENDQVPRFEY